MVVVDLQDCSWDARGCVRSDEQHGTHIRGDHRVESR